MFLVNDRYKTERRHDSLGSFTFSFLCKLRKKERFCLQNNFSTVLLLTNGIQITFLCAVHFEILAPDAKRCLDNANRVGPNPHWTHTRKQSKWNLLMWMGVSTLDLRSNLRVHARPVCDWAQGVSAFSSFRTAFSFSVSVRFAWVEQLHVKCAKC